MEYNVAAQRIVIAMYEAERSAYESFCDAQEEYESEHGEFPNWDEPIIYWNGKKADWFDGGDAARDAETAGMLRFNLSTMEHDAASVEAGVIDWLKDQHQS